MLNLYIFNSNLENCKTHLTYQCQETPPRFFLSLRQFSIIVETLLESLSNIIEELLFEIINLPKER